ncbi:MAG TPA: hypothetical protein PLL10_00085 [Elusimicrobiales bacterium]|nr:hypothetical protein [Elusimicrobiales bacterium]
MGEVIRYCKRCKEFRPHNTQDDGLRGDCRQCGQAFGPPTDGVVDAVAVLEDEYNLLIKAAAEAATRLRIARARQQSEAKGEGEFEREMRELAAKLNVACPEVIPPCKFIEIGRPVASVVGRLYHGEALDDQDVAEDGGAK